MNFPIFEQLCRQGFISSEELEKISTHHQRHVTLSYDLKFILYAGIFLFTTGAGIIIYKHIDSIGHLALVIAIAVITLTCFAYCLFHSKGYHPAKVQSSGLLHDYILLLGSLLLVVLVGYLQFQYQLFGQRWDLAVFLPMVVLFLAAYWFDHLGVLSMAIIHLAAWLGISITPVQLLVTDQFNSTNIINTGILLGVLLLAIAYLTRKVELKKHFAFTYQNFGTHLLLASLLAGVFYTDLFLLYFLLLIIIAAVIFWQAITITSFYFMVVAILYAYIGISYWVTDFTLQLPKVGEMHVYLLLLYFVLSGFGLMFLLIKLNKMFKPA